MTSSALLEEERRTFYVAMTRAEKLLFITAAGERKTFGRTYEAHISRFVQEISSDCMDSFSERNPSSSSFRPNSQQQSADAEKQPVVTVTAKPIPSAPPAREPKIPIRPAAPKSTINWQVGDKLSHRKWGSGVVKNVSNDVLTVAFDSPEIGEKILKAGIAPLEKI